MAYALIQKIGEFEKDYYFCRKPNEDFRVTLEGLKPLCIPIEVK